MSSLSPRIQPSRLPAIAAGLAAVVLAIVIVRLFLLSRSAEPAQQATANRVPAAVVRTAPVVTGSITEQFSYAGAVQAADQVSLVPRTSGIVQSIPVDVGSEVRQGQTLAVLDPGTLPDQVAQAQAGLDQAQAKLQQLLAQGRPDDVAAAEAQLQQAQAKLESLSLQGRSEDIEAARQNVAAQQAKLDQMVRGGRTEATGQAQAALDAANAKLTLTLKGPTEDVRQAAQDAINADVGAVAAAQAAVTNTGNANRSDVQAAQAAVSADQSTLSQAQDALTNLPATFPSDLASAQSAYDAATMRLTSAQQDFEQAKNQTSGAAPAQLATSQATVAQAQAAADQAQATLTALQQGTSSSASGSSSSSANICSRDPNTHALVNAAACTAALTAANSAVTASQQTLTNAQAQLNQTKDGPSPEQIQAQLAPLQQAQDQATADASSARSKLEALEAGGMAQRQNELTSTVTAAQQKLSSDQAKLDALLASGSAAQQEAANSALTAAQEKLKSDQAALAEIQSEPKQEDVDAAQAVVEQARQALALAAQPSSDDDIRAQQALVEQAQAQLAKAIRPNTDDDIRQQREVVSQLQAQLEKAQLPNTNTDIEVARTAVDQARAQLAVAQSSLDETVLTAPFNGVVGQKNLAVGAFASTSSPILVLAGHGLEIHITVEEARVAALAPGQAVAFTLPAYPDESFPGRVTNVAPVGDARAHTFDVTILPASQDSRLLPGMYAQVQVTAAQKDNTVLVPREAVVQQADGSVVFVADNNTAELRHVTLGISDDTNQEILSGVNPDEQVVIQGQTTLRNGQAINAVRVQPTAQPTGGTS
jgi:HlyD family secretion protein